MEKNNSSIATFGFIFTLIFTRVVFDKVDSITYIIYFINVLSLIYVVFQINNRFCTNLNDDSESKIIKRRNDNIRKTMNLSIFLVIIFAFILAIVMKILFTTNELGILNDSLALLTLAISIEDEAVYNWIKKRIS